MMPSEITLTARAGHPPAVSSQVHRRNLARWLRRVALVAIGGSIVGGLAFAFMPEPVPVDVARVERGRLVVHVAEEGRARVKDRYVVLAPLTGELQRITLRVGADVRQGESVARLLPAAPALLDERSREQADARLRAAQASERQAGLVVTRAESAAQQAATDLGRSQELARKGAIPVAELDRATLNDRIATAELQSARFGVRVAVYEVAMARAALKHLDTSRAAPHGRAFDVPAPVTGRVLRISRESEGLAAAGTALIEIAEPGALEVVVDVLTSDAVRIAPGAPAKLTRWGGPELAGRVRMVEPSAFTQVNALGVEEQRVNVVVDLSDPPEKWARLGDGYRVEAQISVWDRPDVLQLPLSAAFRDGDHWAVYRVEAGRARLARVQLGERTLRAAEVLEGLAAGDALVVHPSDKVVEGARVEAR